MGKGGWWGSELANGAGENEAIKGSIESQAILWDPRVPLWNSLKEEHFIDSSHF